MAEKTRIEMVEAVARRFGHYRQGTATGGSTTTVVDTGALYEPDDFFIGHYVYVVEDAGGAGAAPEGEERPVTDYEQETATLTVSPVFSSAVGAGDTYELLKTRRADVVAAINAAIRAAGETWLAMVRDTTSLTIADDDYDYDLPVNVARLLALWVRGDTDEAWVEVPARMWRVTGTPGGPQVLLLDTQTGLSDGDTVQLEYLARPAELTADDGTLGLGQPAETELVKFVEEYALFWLHDQAANQGPEAAGFRPHYTQAQGCWERAAGIQARASRFHGRGTARTKRWAQHRG